MTYFRQGNSVRLSFWGETLDISFFDFELSSFQTWFQIQQENLILNLTRELDFEIVEKSKSSFLILKLLLKIVYFRDLVWIINKLNWKMTSVPIYNGNDDVLDYQNKS